MKSLGMILGSRQVALIFLLTIFCIPISVHPANSSLLEVNVSTSKGRILDGVKTYGFSEAGVYTGLSATSDSNGTATYDTLDFVTGNYKFRIDYLGYHFWSEALALPDNVSLSIVIEEETAEISLDTPLEGVKIYLFTENGAYQGVFQISDGSGNVAFELPTGNNYKCRADYLGSQYWSGVVAASGEPTTFTLAMEGGLLEVVVQKAADSPIAGIKTYLFNQNGSYLGQTATTDVSGLVQYEVTGGNYQIRADYLGSQFWSDVYPVPAVLSGIIDLPHQEITVSVNGLFQDAATPISNIPVYLFTLAGSYLSLNSTTDGNGQVVFNLPVAEYKVRADYLGQQIWSQPFSVGDVNVDIPIAETEVTVSGSGLGLEGVTTYMFSASGSYLNLHEISDAFGKSTFSVPAGTYKVRADYQGSQYWSADEILVADQVNPVEVSTGGGEFRFNVSMGEAGFPAGVTCYVFNEAGSYLNLSGETDENGDIFLNLADGSYKFRVDYLGYQIWSEIYAVPESLAGVVDLPHRDVTITAQRIYQGEQTPASAIKIYLFTPSGSYLSMNQTTDINGQVLFNLPDLEYKVRADYLGQQFWSDVFKYTDTTVAINQGLAEVHVHNGNTDIVGAKVYLFSESGSYLALNKTIDDAGRASFELPHKSFKFRADVDGEQHWSQTINIQPDIVNNVDMDIAPISVTIDATPQTITAGGEEGGSSFLSWSSTGAETCSIEPEIGTVEVSSGEGGIEVFPTETTTYTISATGLDGTATASVIVTVGSVQPVPSVTISSSLEVIDPEGEITSALLSWNSTNADSCVIEPEIGNVALSSGEGGIEISPAETTTYTITATGPGGTATASVAVTVGSVQPVPTVTISASPEVIDPEGEITSALLAWNSTNADSCVIEPEIGNVSLTSDEGGIEVSPAETTTYTITATGPGGTATASVTVTVGSVQPVPTVTISASPEVIDPEGEITSALLLWNSTNADSCVIEPEIGNVSLSSDEGGIEVYPLETTTYTITATGPGGTSTASVEVTVPGSLQLPQNKLIADDAAAFDHFGLAVDISGDFVIVGAPYDDNTATDAGAAYIFKKEGSEWDAGIKLLADGGASGDSFGTSVSISGDYTMVGAMYADYTMESSGAAYIYRYDGVNWVQQIKIPAISSGTQYLGESVAISQKYAVCGGDGRVVIYKQEGNNWIEMAILADPLYPDNYSFGNLVSIYDDTVIVGAGTFAYIFRFNGLEWREEARFAGWTRDTDITSVSIYGDAAALGFMYVDDPVNSWVGAVDLYQYHEGHWVQRPTLTPDVSSHLIGFGSSVDIRGNYLVVGAQGFVESEWNTNGSSYVFKRDGTTWQEMGKILAADGEEHDNFGTFIAMSGANIIVGANGDSEAGSYTGAAYIYELPNVIVEFAADPKITPTGESIFTWYSANADSCSIEPGIGNVPLTGSLAVTAVTTTEYTLTCHSSTETATANATIEVGYPSPAIIASSSAGLIDYGETVILSWETLNAESVTIDNGIGIMPANGSVSVTPDQPNIVYSLTATGPGGEDSYEVSVEVIFQIPSIEISALSESIQIGDTVTLTWSTTHADTCSIDQGVGDVPVTGSITVTPTEIAAISTYTITASNPGETASKNIDISVSFPPPTVDLTVAKLQEPDWQLEWQTTNAYSSTITPEIGDVPVNSSTVVSPTENTVYTIYVSGPGGSVTASVAAFVEPGPAITIIFPQEGDEINKPGVMVKGLVFHSDDLEIGVSVNGMPALMDGDQFVVNNLRLAEGQNTIIAKATDISGNQAEYSISVNSEATGAYIQLLPDREAGLSPLEFSFKIDATFSLTSAPVFSSSGPGTTEIIEMVGENEYKFRITTEGLYYITAEVADEEGNNYSDTVAILVYDRNALDAKLKTKWEGMKTAISSSDIENALEYFIPSRRSSYNIVFSDLVSHLGTIIPESEIELVDILDGKASYVIDYVVDVNGVPMTLSSFIILEKDDDGLWRIIFF